MRLAALHNAAQKAALCRGIHCKYCQCIVCTMSRRYPSAAEVTSVRWPQSLWLANCVSSYSIDIDSLPASLLVFIQHIQPRGLVNVRPAFIRSGDNRDIEVCYIGFHPELSVCVLSESGGGAEYRNFVLILQQAKPCHCQKTSGRQFQTDPGSSSD